MGNDQSRLKGLQIDKNAVEINDFWSLYNAEIPNNDSSTLLSIFQEEQFVSGQLWITQTPLRRAVKNLMIYRHPCILKYVTSWDQGSKKHLATERCQPLSLVIQSLSDIQICLGLKNILNSLIFLVEQAKAHHLNICLSSIYMNTSGEWRLGGFEHVWKFKEITKDLLNLTKSYRYDKAIDPNEMKNFNSTNNSSNNNNNDFGIEQYAFAVFCEELLINRKNSSTPYIKEFCDYCLTHLKHQNILLRPKLSAVLLHPYFNHEFIIIHTFLTELPLKLPQDKQDFFTSLIDRLRYFDENLVASQIGNLLLSRMVLLDTTAQLCVTPYVLKIKNDITSALFSTNVYQLYMIPHIKKIFCVRDAQIRLILLEYFNDYVKLLTKDELQYDILPNLLLGIKDTNDILVAKTLRCLADLIPILGSKIVIGSNRKRLFADGRPQCLPNNKNYWIEPRSITPVMNAAGEYIASASPLPSIDTINNDTISGSFVSMTTITTNNNNHNNSSNNDNNNSNIENNMPERLSPDGGEDVQTATTYGHIDDEEEAWSDWENDEIRNSNITTDIPNIDTNSLNNDNSIERNENDVKQQISLEFNLKQLEQHQITTNSVNKIEMKKSNQIEQQLKSPIKLIDNINELDIKNQKFKLSTNNDEIDFFKDMEPIIQKNTNNLLIQKYDKSNNNNNSNDLLKTNEIVDIEVDKSRFEIKIDDHENIQETGWDDDQGDWEA